MNASASMPRRPARTSQRPAEREVFWRVEAQGNGLTRACLGIERGDMRRALKFAAERGGLTVGRFFVFASEAAAVARALQIARSSGWSGRQVAGSWWTTAGDHQIAVWVQRRRDTGAPAIYFGRSRADGAFLGKPAPVDEPQFDALDRALSWLTEAP